MAEEIEDIEAYLEAQVSNVSFVNLVTMFFAHPYHSKVISL